MPPLFAKLIGLGAFGAIALFAGIFALLVYLTLPSASGGMNMTLAVVAWLAVGLTLLAVIGVHVLIGRQLLALAAEGAPPPDRTR